jgi:hypothetical protein
MIEPLIKDEREIILEELLRKLKGLGPERGLNLLLYLACKALAVAERISTRGMEGSH